MGKGENSDPPLLQAQLVRDYHFGLKMGLLLASCLDYHFTIFTAKEQPMTNEGAKRNVPHLLQTQQALVCLWSISEKLQCQKFQGIFT